MTLNNLDTFFITGIQQLGIGTPDMARSWAWYKRYFSMYVKVFQEEAEAPYMTQYTGGAVQSRNATLAVNPQGGSGFEIWQYTSRKSAPPPFNISFGDSGILCGRIRCYNIEKQHRLYAEDPEITVLTSIGTAAGRGERHFFVRDLYGNLFAICESTTRFRNKHLLSGGPDGAIIGVSNLKTSIPFYRDILGYSEILSDTSGVFADLHGVPGGERNLRRVLLSHPEARKGGFSRYFGKSFIELVQPLEGAGRKTFEGRFWGDMGFIHLCFDVAGMDHLASLCEKRGYPVTVDTKDTFDMGEAGGRFCYTEDPDGTLIEFVETHKIPIIAKIGFFLDLSRRDPRKPLPDFLMKAMEIGSRP